MFLEEQGYSTWRCGEKAERKEMRVGGREGWREGGRKQREMSSDNIMPRSYGPY